MFVIAHDRRRGSMSVHYLPEGRVLATEDGILLSRMGNTVIVQTGRDRITVDAPGTINMTEKLLHFLPLNAVFTGEASVEDLHRIEEIAWSAELPNKVRRFLRIYGAILGLRMLDAVPNTFKESVVLTVSRLSGEPIGKIMSEKGEILRKLEEELHETLRELPPELLRKAVNVVIAP